MGQYQRKHVRRQRKSRFPWIYKLLSALGILAAIAAGCIVFFRVDEIRVEGNARYTEEEIIDASGITQGDNLFLINKYESMDGILSELTYVGSVSVRRELPSAILITVTETDVAAAVQDLENETWWCISSAGKLLERCDDPGEYTQVTGLTPLSPSEGTALSVGEEEKTACSALLSLLQALEEADLLDAVGAIDLSSASEIVMEYDGRLIVRMEQTADLDYDVEMLSAILEDYIAVYWSETDTGTLDMTTSDGQPHLTRDAS